MSGHCTSHVTSTWRVNNNTKDGHAKSSTTWNNLSPRCSHGRVWYATQDAILNPEVRKCHPLIRGSNSGDFSQQVMFGGSTWQCQVQGQQAGGQHVDASKTDRYL